MLVLCAPHPNPDLRAMNLRRSVLLALPLLFAVPAFAQTAQPLPAASPCLEANPQR